MSRGPQRIVSLVPSETFNVARLGALDRLIARTRYCDAPEEAAAIGTIGGTKDVAVADVIALQPDLVLANREENNQADVQALLDAGLNVRVVFPKTVREGLQDLVELAELLGAAEPCVHDAKALMQHGPSSRKGATRCFVPIWRNPWMTVTDDTYIGDVLRWLGAVNVFGDLPSCDAEGRDTRYPRVTFEQVEQAQPEWVLLPDEPYRFEPKHRALFEALGLPAEHIVCVSGRDLCWHGAWAVDGLPRLAGLFGAL